ncbi:MAG: helix-hairpin-helix domain-containing protein, partial [Anaerolineales bacterium]|nr:helix-hairpin-helix domain-containing protein [Anaerolineales bacterium]
GDVYKRQDGVGPRIALAVISGAGVEMLQRAVFNEESDLLARVPGVGKKTAQKITLYLKDRLKPLDAFQAMATLSDVDSEVLAALTALGYSVVEAQMAIQSLPKDAPQELEERLRLALQQFRAG